MTYQNHVRKGTARGRDGIPPQALADNISEIAELISRKSRQGTYRFTSYRQMLISKGASRPPRVISIPTARDRIILKSLAKLIESVYPDSKGRMPQSKVSQLHHAAISGRFDSFVRLDIENFYPSIPHEVIMKTLRKKIRKREVLTLLQRAIETPTLSDNAPRLTIRHKYGVPQGLPISNSLAEIAMRILDEKFTGDPTLFYLRYVDDIIVLCDSQDTESIFEKIAAECGRASLTVHNPKTLGSKSKIGLLSDTTEYLGYVFSPTKVSVRPESIKKVKSSIARVFTRYKYEVSRAKPGDEAAELKARGECSWKLDLVITGCIFGGQRRGWIHYFSQITDLSVLQGLDVTVSKFLKRFGLENKFEPKSFIRAFWSITKGGNLGSSYIPNFDEYTAQKKREALSNYFKVKDALSLSDQMTDQIFYQKIKRTVAELEQDFSEIS